MKPLSVLVAVGCMLAVASGQWLEKTIWLPDSFPELVEPRFAFHNPVTNRIYFAGREEPAIHVLDPASAVRQGFSDTVPGCHDAAHCYNEHMIWFGSEEDWKGLVGFDDRADTVVQAVHGLWPSGLEYNPVMGKLYVAEEDGLVVLDARTGGFLSLFDSVPDATTWVVYDSLRNRVYLSGRDWEDAPIAVFDCRTDSVIAGIPITGEICDMCFDRTRDRLYYLCFDGTPRRNVVRTIDPDSPAVVSGIVIPLSGIWNQYDGRLIPDFEHGRLYAAYINHNPQDGSPRPWEDTVAVIDLVGDTLLALVGLPREFQSGAFAFNSAERKLYLSSGTYDSVAVIDAGDTIRGFIPTPSGPGAIGWSPQSNLVVATTDADTVLILDGAADTVAATVDYYHFPADWLTWNPAGRKLYLGNELGIGWVGDADTVEHWLPAKLVHKPFAFSQELNRLYLPGRVGPYRDAKVYDCNLDSVVKEVSVPYETNRGLLLPEYHKMYVASGDSVRTYDLYQDSIVAAPNFRIWTNLRYNPRSGMVYGFCRNYSSVLVVDPRVDSVVGEVPVYRVVNAEVNGRDNELWTWCSDSTLRVVDCEVHRIVDQVQLGRGLEPGVLKWAPRENKMYCVQNQPTRPAMNRLNVVDCASRTWLDSIELDMDVSDSAGLFYNPRNSKLYVWGFSWRPDYVPKLQVVDCRYDSIVATFEVPVDAFAWNPVDNRMYAASRARISVFRDEMTGLELEAGSPEPGRALATIVRRVLFLPPASGVERGASSVLLDIAGRKVVALLPGPNDVRALPAGVYFVRGPSAVSVRKVLVQR